MHLKAIPTFRIKDPVKAKEFYIDFLDCQLDWEHRFSLEQPVHMQVSKNGMVLHLSDNPRFNPAIIYVETVNLEQLHHELIKKQTPFNVPDITKTPWGTWQMELEDPFGNLMRFNEIGQQN